MKPVLSVQNQKIYLIYESLSSHTGLVLYEYQAAEMMLAKRIFESRKYNKREFRRKLDNILKSLLESITILQFSYSGSDEYKMGQAAQGETVVYLRQWIAALK